MCYFTVKMFAGLCYFGRLIGSAPIRKVPTISDAGAYHVLIYHWQLRDVILCIYVQS